MLFSGCCAVSIDPAVCVWKRSSLDFSLLAWKRSDMIRYHMRRDARNFATSSKKSLCPFQKKERRGANSSTSRPASIAACTYAIPLESVNAISCTAVLPASRMW